MKRAIFIAIAALAAASLACSVNVNLPVTVAVPRITTGPTETLDVSVPRPSADVGDVTVEMGAGQLTLAGGADGLVGGQIQYNVPDWKPTITTDGASTKIRQPNISNLGLPGDNVVNKWDLTLGDMPMNLTVTAGAYEGELNLGGVPLRSLTVRDGASKADVIFADPNPEEMDELRYETGASTVSFTGLGNANFDKFTFTGGAGQYKFDFSGDWQRDTTINIKGGLSSMSLTFPQGTAVQVKVTGGLNNVNTTGTWTQSGDSYSLSGSGPTLTVSIDMGAGDLNLIVK